jgi:hypothetical protein
MAKKSERRVPKWVSNAERREFAGNLAEKKYEGWNDASASMLKIGYAKGIEDAMLTPDDIKAILTLYHNVIGDGIENIYPEVLKRFNEIKFKK